MNSISILIQLSIIINYVCSFPSGAPLRTCGDMIPGHPGTPITNSELFKIIVKPHNSERLDVSIVAEDPAHFKGFLIEARNDLNKHEAIGLWDTDVKRTKTIHCFDSPHSAVTHHHGDDDDDDDENDHDDDDDDDDEEDEDEQEKKHHFRNITFRWYPSSSLKNNQTISFIATVVKKYTEVYTNIVKTFTWSDIEFKIASRNLLNKNESEQLNMTVNSTSPVEKIKLIELIKQTGLNGMNKTVAKFNQLEKYFFKLSNSTKMFNL